MEAMATRSLRRRLLEFHFEAAQHLQLRPMVKYTSLSFFLDRFMPSLQRGNSSRKLQAETGKSWLLEHLRESNLQLFVLISIWISSKIHDSQPLSVRSLKALSDKLISDQHFTSRDFSDAELVFLEVMGYDIGTSRTVFLLLEDLFVHLREVSKLGETIEMETCMDIMDLLYDEDTISPLFVTSSDSLAASILVCAYLISVPKQQWEFPLLPWGYFIPGFGHLLCANPQPGINDHKFSEPFEQAPKILCLYQTWCGICADVKFITSHEEEDIMRVVGCILLHVLKPEEVRHQN